MKALIEVSNKTIGVQSVQSVLAKELYLGLGLSEINWSAWSDLNIVENGFFTENVDWTRFLLNKNRTNGVAIKDFAVSLDFAKHIAMMAKTEKAHDYRNYFLECERQTKSPKTLTTAEMILGLAQTSVDLEKRVAATQESIDIVAARVNDISIDLRNGVPHGFISKKLARVQSGNGLSKEVFEMALSDGNITTQKYIHYQEGQAISTFAYKLNEIEPIISAFLADAVQVTKQMCFSSKLNKRFLFQL